MFAKPNTEHPTPHQQSTNPAIYNLSVFTPYDWQEGIGNRAQYIEGKLSQGVPVLALSIKEGILVLTYRRQAQKIYEMYDRLIFSAIGQQSDVEAMRMAALEFASREGYNRSDEDVTIQRVVNALSAPLKRAFGDFGSAPIVARSLFAEVGESIEQDRYYIVDYDGDYVISKDFAVVAGTSFATQELAARIAEISSSSSVDETIRLLQETHANFQAQNPASDDEEYVELTPEAALLERSRDRENRFTFVLKPDN